MKNNCLLILDLDDTIFETKSIGKQHVASILEDFEESIQTLFEAAEVDLIMSDLWKYPFDHVSKKYNLNGSIKQQFSNSINGRDYKLDIKPFDDFEVIRTIQVPKVLVTTGFKKLQLAKVSALNLENAFDEIHIDEIDSKERMHKKGIFEQLIRSKNIAPKDFFVIGDNPDSEISAGYELGFTTVQVAKFAQQKSPLADHYIQNFKSLITILEER